jgi:predicted GNAT family acetyltransferase
MLATTENLSVEREDGERRGRYVIHLPGGGEAELTYGRGDDNILIADHTYVPPDFRGHGLAEKLVHRVVADARREGAKILPLCSYVAAQFRRHPDWAPLRA